MKLSSKFLQSARECCELKWFELHYCKQKCTAFTHIGINMRWVVLPYASVILKWSWQSSPGSQRDSTCTCTRGLGILFWLKDIMWTNGTCLKSKKKRPNQQTKRNNSMELKAYFCSNSSVDLSVFCLYGTPSCFHV